MKSLRELSGQFITTDLKNIADARKRRAAKRFLAKCSIFVDPNCTTKELVQSCKHIRDFCRKMAIKITNL